jgi:hypothetical protein
LRLPEDRLRLPEERDLLEPEERDLLEPDERDLLEPDELRLLLDVDRVFVFDPEREPLERDELDFFRVAGFFAVERLVEVPDREVLRAGVLAAGATGIAVGAGVAGAAAGAVAEALWVRAPATGTRTSKPSSASAIRAPAVIAIAAARPRNTPIFNVGEPATSRHKISRTARAPSAAVKAPRRSGMFSRSPFAARPASAMPATPERMIRKPGRSDRASHPLTPGCSTVSVPAATLPLTSAPPPPNQSKNRKKKRAMPPMPATISPVRSLEESKSASIYGCGPRLAAAP